MSSGFIQLAALGQQDVYLTGTPSLTYFASVYKRHTPFVLEAYEIPFKGSAIAMGQNNVVQIPVKGDLVRATTLRLNLPPLATYGADWFYPPGYSPFLLYINGTPYKTTFPFGLQPYSSNITSFSFWAQYITPMGYDSKTNKFTFPVGSTIQIPQVYATFFGFDIKNSIGIVDSGPNRGFLIYNNVPDFTLEQAGWIRSPGLYVNTLSNLFLQCKIPKNTPRPSYIDLTTWTNEDAPTAWTITPRGRFYFNAIGIYNIRANFLFSLGTDGDSNDGEPLDPLITNSPDIVYFQQPVTYLPETPYDTLITYYIYSTGPIDSNSYIYIEQIDAYFLNNNQNSGTGALYTKGDFIRLGSDFIIQGYGAKTTGDSIILPQSGTYILSGVVTADVPIQSIDIVDSLHSSTVLFTETFPSGTYCTGEFFFSFVNSTTYKIRVNTATDYTINDYTYFTIKYQGLPNGGTSQYSNGGYIIPFNGVLETKGAITYPLDFSTFTSNGASTFLSFSSDVSFLNVGTYLVTSYFSNANTIIFSNVQSNYYYTAPYRPQIPIRIDTPLNLCVTVTYANQGPWSNVTTILPTLNVTDLFSDLSGNLYCLQSNGGNYPNSTLIYKITGSTLSLVAGAGRVSPQRTTTDLAGNIYLYQNLLGIRQFYIIPVGQSIQVFAGSGTPGSVDGPVNLAGFDSVQCCASTRDGTIYFSETSSTVTRIRKIQNGYVSTLISQNINLAIFISMAINSKNIVYLVANSGTIYTFDPLTNSLNKIPTNINYINTNFYLGIPFKDATFNLFAIVCVRFDSQDNLYILDQINCSVLKVTNRGNILFTIAGGNTSGGSIDGIGPNATLVKPGLMAVTGVDTVYVACVAGYQSTPGLRYLRLASQNNFTQSEYILFAPATSTSIPVSYEGYHYYDSVGTWAIETAELKIGGQTIQRLTGEAIEIWNDINVPYENQPALALLTGKYDTTISAGRDYYVNLPFYFYGNSGSYLPISTINRQDVEIWITFRTLQALTAIPVLETNPVQATLIVEYVYLDQPEIAMLGRSSLEYVIDQYQYQSFKLSNGNFEIILENPVTCLFFVIQQDGAVPYNWFNDGLQRLGLSFNGEEILTNRITDTTQLGIIEPFENFINFPTRNFYSKTFKSPINFSRIRQVLLELTITGDQARTFRMTGVSKNVLRIADGLAGLMFISP